VPEEAPKFSLRERWITVTVALLTLFGSSVGSYTAFRSLIEWRIAKVENDVSDHGHRIEAIETIGVSQRIAKLEDGQVQSDKNINEINRKLDVTVAILDRIERIEDQRHP
jgi:hypothetical protein